MSSSNSCRIGIISLAAVGAMCATGAADVVENWYLSVDGHVTLGYRLNHMPDFDQRRAAASGIIGLPGNGGMYCAPTAAMNLMAYAANHGYPNFPPGEALWQLQANYNPSGLAVFNMGALMSTHPQDGTNGSGSNAGYNAWIGQQPQLMHLAFYASNFDAPTFDEIAELAQVTGGIMAFCYGRYEVDIVQQSGALIAVGDRTGGHCVTFTQAHRDGSVRTIGYRDPADDSSSLTTQSVFVDRIANVRNHSIVTSNGLKTMSSLDYSVGDDLIRLIDSVHLVMPLFGLSFTPNTAVLVMPHLFLGFQGSSVKHVPFPIGQLVIDQVPDPQGLSIFQLVQSAVGGPASLRRFSLLDGSSQMLLPAIPGATDLAFGRLRELYILAGSQLHRVDPFAEDPVLATINPPMPCQAIAFDDFNNQVVLLSVTGRRLYRYPAGLPVGVIPQQIIIPTSIPMAGDGSVTVNPVTHRSWFLTQGGPGVYSAFLNEAGGVLTQGLLLPAVQGSTAVDFDTQGHMFLSRNGQIVELFESSLAGWQVLPNSPWAGIPIGGKLVMGRSRNNIVPAIHDTPEWRNIDPSELIFDTPMPDCVADLNNDNTVNGVDLGVLLAAWSIPTGAPGCGGAVQCYSDMNHDGRVDGVDLGILLSGWGPCE